MEDTFDDCCGHQRECKVITLINCTDPVEEDCDFGKTSRLIENPGTCPEYVCFCVDPKDCPNIETTKNRELKKGTFKNRERNRL